MKTVKRNEQGEITHIRVENEMFTKEDADKINFVDVDVNKFLKKTGASKKDLETILFDLINERKSVEQFKIHILKTLRLIEDKPRLEK